jgi:ribose-phosphate pyrophosphokinase
VRDATVLVVDELISTGGTIARAARAAAAAGARRVVALAAHGLFMPGAPETLAAPELERIVVADAVPAFRLAGSPLMDKVDRLPSAPLLAEAIRRLATDEPLTDLLVF